MTTQAPPAQEDAAAHRRPLQHLVATFSVQSLAASGFIFYVLIAPNLAAATGLPERDFGLALTFIFIGTAVSSPLTGLYMRLFGSVGAHALALVWMGAVILVTHVGTWEATMLSAFLFGLGYGPVSPLSMTIVTERTPRPNRGLFLAIRQSSQPLAGVILGRLLPPLMLAYGWQTGVISISVAVALGFLIIFVWPSLFRLRDERALRQRAKPRPTPQNKRWLSILLGRLVIPRELRVLWLAGIIFAITQVGIVFFTYIYLLEEVKLSPIEAGIFSSNLQLAGLFGRPLFGWLCDRLGRTDIVLVAIALISIVAAYGLVRVDAEWGVAAFFALALACGFSGQAWNPVFTAAMGEIVPRERLAEMNGRAFGFLSLGWMSGAPFCWLLIETFENYRALYMTLIAMNLVIAIALSIWAFRRGRGGTKTAA